MRCRLTLRRGDAGDGDRGDALGSPRPAGEDATAGFAETDPGAVRSRGRGGKNNLVAVLQEGPLGAAYGNRLLPAPGELDEGAALVPVGSGDGARREQVAGAGRRR